MVGSIFCTTVESPLLEIDLFFLKMIFSLGILIILKYLSKILLLRNNFEKKIDIHYNIVQFPNINMDR